MGREEGRGVGREEWRDGIKMREEARRRGGRLHGEVVRRRGKMEDTGEAEVKWGERRELFRLDSHMYT